MAPCASQVGLEVSLAKFDPGYAGPIRAQQNLEQACPDRPLMLLNLHKDPGLQSCTNKANNCAEIPEKAELSESLIYSCLLLWPYC